MSRLRALARPGRLVAALVLVASAAAGGCTLGATTAPVTWCDPRDPRQIDWTRELEADPGNVPAPSCQPYPG